MLVYLKDDYNSLPLLKKKESYRSADMCCFILASFPNECVKAGYVGMMNRSGMSWIIHLRELRLPWSQFRSSPFSFLSFMQYKLARWLRGMLSGRDPGESSVCLPTHKRITASPCYSLAGF